MKRNLIFIVFLLAALFACSKKESSSTQSSNTATTTFPTKASDYITNNYPDASVDYIMTLTNSQARFIAVLNTTEELAFTQSGDFLGDGREFHHGDSIPGDTVHCDSMPGWHHGHHGHGHHGHPGPGPGPGGHGDDGFGIPPDSLPQTILNYVNTNYPGAMILHANYDTVCPDGAVITVMVGVLGTEPLKLFFDNSDNYIYQGHRFAYIDMPQAVKDYITANYAGFNICPKGEKFIMPDNSIQYKAYMHQAFVRKAVRLKDDGTLVCVQ